MSLLIIIGCIWGICKLISAASAASKERARQAEIERVRRAQERQRAEQARMREEWKAAQAAERERVRQMVALEREQVRQAKEQERLAKEQEKQAAAIAKHEEQIAKLTFRMERAEQDIEYLDGRMRNLMAKRDNYMAQQAACTPMSKDWDKWQTKIISLDNQIHSAESRIANARFTREQAKAKLSA